MPSDPPRYTLSWNQNGIDRLRALAERAKELGVLAEGADTLRQIRDRLQADPRGCGDPLYPLRALRLMTYRTIVDRVEVIYGVHESSPVVFVRDVVPRSGHPLETP